jgi:hypothetical protein
MGAFVQTVLESTYNPGTGTVATRTVSLPVAVPVGDTLLLCASGESSSILSSVTDSRGNTWTVGGTVNNGLTLHVGFAHCHVTTALQVGDTVTVTEGSARNTLNIAIHQFTAMDTTAAVDKAASGTGTSVSPATAATATTTQALELLYACFCINDQAQAETVTAGTGYMRLTYITTTRGTADRGLIAEYQFVQATGAYTGTCTISVSKAWAATIGTYKALAAPPPPTGQASPAAILGHL